jgi:hypothetical protein
MEKLIKTDIPNLVRDMDSRAILNTNTNEYLAYKTKRDRERKLNSVVDEIDQIKQDMADIKSMLQQIIGNRS